MCYNRTYKNKKQNRLHARCLQLIYNDKRTSFQDLLQKVNSVFIHHKNIQELATEIFKVNTKTSPEIMKDVFWLKNKEIIIFKIKQIL